MYSPNMTAFLERFPAIIDAELASYNQRVCEANTRVNASKARMIKAGISLGTDPRIPFENINPEEQKYRNSVISHIQETASRDTFKTAIDKYMAYIALPENDDVRHFVDQDLPTINTVEDLIYFINLSHFDYLFDNHEFNCLCDSTSDNYQEILYASTDPEQHIIVPCKIKCSYGTPMKMKDVNSLLKGFDFIDYGTEFLIEFVKA
jgi:hypothetical protein